jgi:hypothetical protein
VSTAATSTSGAHARPTLGADVRAVTLTVLAGAAAGALAGALVGGLGGRLVMLILRLTSDPIVIGVTSDDGFEIGRITLGGTIGLVGGLAALGAANGAVYAVLRGSIPPRLRAALWALFAAAVGGSQFVHADGVDFTLLEPVWFAVLAFVALPGIAGLVVVLLVERWLGEPGRRPRPAALALGAALGTVALAFVAAVGLVALVVRRLGLADMAARLGRLVVPAGLVVGILAGAWYTAVEASRILG